MADNMGKEVLAIRLEKELQADTRKKESFDDFLQLFEKKTAAMYTLQKNMNSFIGEQSPDPYGKMKKTLDDARCFQKSFEEYLSATAKAIDLLSC